MNHAAPPSAQGFYDPRHEHDACGLGFIAHIKGQKSREIVTQGLQILTNLTHRGAPGPIRSRGRGRRAPPAPHAFFLRECERLGIALPEVGEYGVGMTFLPAIRRPRRLRARGRARRPRRRAGAARLARRPRRQQRPRPGREGQRACDSPGLRRSWPLHAGRRRLRAQALCHPQAIRPRHPRPWPRPRQRVLRALVLGADDRLQRHAPRAPGRRVLPRSAGP